MDVSHVYVCALVLGCLHSLISTQIFRRALTAGQLRGDKECPFSGVTKSGRGWRKVPESGAWSVLTVRTCYPCIYLLVDGGGFRVEMIRVFRVEMISQLLIPIPVQRLLY